MKIGIWICKTESQKKAFKEIRHDIIGSDTAGHFVPTDS